MPSSMQLFYRGPGCATKTFGHIILIALLLSTFTISSVLAGTLLVSRLYDNVISQVDSHTGEILNANFITGLKTPFGVVFDAQGHLFVANFDGGTVGKYDANTGAVINADFIKGLRLEAVHEMQPGSVRVFANDTVVEDLVEHRLEAMAHALHIDEKKWRAQSVLTNLEAEKEEEDDDVHS